jgi:hypothetical protein
MGGGVQKWWQSSKTDDEVEKQAKELKYEVEKRVEELKYGWRS